MGKLANRGRSLSETVSSAYSVLGNFSIDQLTKEFEQEQKGQGNLAHVVSRREKRLANLEKKFIDVSHMEKIEKPEYLEGMPYHQQVCTIVNNPKFSYAFFVLVTFYSIVMGCELQFDAEKYDTRWFRLNCAFMAAFGAECVLKLYAYGHKYFLVTWFILEFVTTGASIIALGMVYRGFEDTYRKTFTILKISRIILMGKLFSMREEFQVIVLGFSRSLISLWGVFFVILVVCYGCTLFCFSVIGKHSAYQKEYSEWHSEAFGTIPKTMMTLFSMVIVDEWAGYARPVYEVQPPVVFFFFFFTVMLTLGLLNVVTGMVVDTVNTVSKDNQQVHELNMQRVQKKKLEKIIDMVFGDCEDHEPISEDEFKNHDNKEELMGMVGTVDFPASFTLKDLFIVLDFPGHKNILKNQFVDGVMNFIHGDIFHLDCQILLSINKVFRDIIAARKEMRVMHHGIQKNFPVESNDEDLADEPEDRPRASFSDMEVQPVKKKEKTAHFGTFSVEDLATEFENERLADQQSSCIAELPKKGRRRKKKRSLAGMVGAFVITNAEERMDMPLPAYLRDMPMQPQLAITVESRGFKAVYYFMVAMFSMMMGFELEYDDEKYKNRWFYMNSWFTFMFSMECFCKLYAYGHNYFRVPWFCLEFVTTMGGFITLGMKWYGMADTYTTIFVCVKLSRVLLLGKLFNLRTEFEIIVLGFTRSLFNLWGILFVLLVINYGCTLFCYSVIGKHQYSEETNADHEMYWGSIPKTMITLFSMMITDNWGGYSRPVYEEQPPVVLFFFLYTVMLTMGLLNVVTGMVVDTVNSVKSEHEKNEQEQQKESQKTKLRDIVDVVFRHGLARAHEITEEEFVNHSSANELNELLEIVDFPHHFTLRDFFTILDTSGHKTLYKAQFVDGLVTLINSNAFHRECQILLGVHKLRRGIVELRKELATLHHRVRALPSLGDPDVPLRGQSFKRGMSMDKFMTSKPQLVRGASMVGAKGKPIKLSAEMRATGVEALATPPPSDIRALSAEMRQKRLEKSADVYSDHWEQLRATLHDAAMERCFEELRLAWTALEFEYRNGEPIDPDQNLFPAVPSPAGAGTTLAELQEIWFVWHKLYGAVCSESLHDLRLALEHAKIIGIGEKSCAILFTFCDALARNQQIIGFSTNEVTTALERGDWMEALDLVIEVSLARGADKSLLLNALARLCAESSSSDAMKPDVQFGQSGKAGAPVATTFASTFGLKPVEGGEAKLAATAQSVLKPVEATEDMRGRLVAVLHTEAAEHAERELKKAWEELDRAHRASDLNPAVGPRGGFGAGYSPFSKQEELFFIRNQINNGVLQESLLDLRRALAHAMSFGIDMRTMEIEVAYRDALARHNMGSGFEPGIVAEALDRGDWWTAIDDIIGASFARGADRHMLLKMIAKVCSPTSNFPTAKAYEFLKDVDGEGEGQYGSEFTQMRRVEREERERRDEVRGERANVNGPDLDSSKPSRLKRGGGLPPGLATGNAGSSVLSNQTGTSI